jgi:DNA-binding helix-hairpin-helix protein with protein kinase domain
MKRKNISREQSASRRLPIFQFQFDETVTKGLAELARKFPFVHAEGVRLSDQRQQSLMAGRLIALGLGYVEKTASLLMAVIN